MMPNPYLYEKMVQAHHVDLLREAEQQRLLVHLPRYRESWIRHLVRKLGVLLVALGTSLQRLDTDLRTDIQFCTGSRSLLSEQKMVRLTADSYEKHDKE